MIVVKNVYYFFKSVKYFGVVIGKSDKKLF